MTTSAPAADKLSTPPRQSVKTAASKTSCDGTVKTSPSTPSSPATTIKPGDILGFSGYHPASIAINLVTYGIPFWHLSHVGIVGEHCGELVLFESCITDPDPCVITGKHFSGTQAH